MKQFITTSLIFTISSCCLSQEIKVKEANQSFSSGSHNALLVNIYEADKATVEKEWKKLVKDFHPEKTNENKGEYMFDNATFKQIGNNTVDVYSKTEEKSDKSIQLVVCFDLGGAYLNSSEHKDKYEYFKKLLYDFAVNTSRESLNEELKQASKLLESTTDKQHSLEKDNKDLEEEIVSYNEKITKDKEKIAKNKTEIEAKKKEAETEQKAVEVIKAKIHAMK